MEFSEEKKLKLQEIQKDIKSMKVRKLIGERALDDDSYLPVYPSAQWWRNATIGERTELKLAVGSAGKDWKEYESKMQSHWPQAKPPRQAVSYKERRQR